MISSLALIFGSLKAFDKLNRAMGIKTAREIEKEYGETNSYGEVQEDTFIDAAMFLSMRE